jgi:hypothetical protein
MPIKEITNGVFLDILKISLSICLAKYKFIETSTLKEYDL